MINVIYKSKKDDNFVERNYDSLYQARYKLEKLSKRSIEATVYKNNKIIGELWQDNTLYKHYIFYLDGENNMSPLNKILQEVYKEVSYYELKNLSNKVILGVVKFDDRNYRFNSKEELQEWCIKSGYTPVPYPRVPTNILLEKCKKYPHISEAALGMPKFKPDVKYYFYNKSKSRFFKDNPLKYGDIYSFKLGPKNPDLGLINLEFSFYKTKSDKSPSKFKSVPIKEKDLEKIIKYDLMNVSRYPYSNERTLVEWDKYFGKRK